MKTKLFFLIAIAAIVASCDNSNDNEPKVFQIDPTATVNIKPAEGTQLRVKSATQTDSHLSALEIVKQTYALKLTTPNGGVGMRGFDPMQRDTVSATPMLKMWGTDILYYTQLIDGTFTDSLVLSPDFLEAKNCLLIDIKGDTLAYIPNTILRSAETQIKTLFAEKNYEPIYTIFNNAYTFTPITGAEYRALNQE